MTEKFENQQVMSGTAVAVVLGAECQSFSNWPQGQLPAPLLAYGESAVEMKLDVSVSHIREGKSSKKAEKALAAVYEPHAIIRTPWGMLGGLTLKCSKGDKWYHCVDVHTQVCWDLDTPEITDRFGFGEEFAPYADVAYELVNAEVHKYNATVEDYPIEVTLGFGFGLLELNCKFNKTADQAEDKAAFASLMRFTESLFENGRMDEIIAQSCDPSVLKRAMISVLGSAELVTELAAVKKISGSRAKLCKYENVPVLSSASAAAALMEVGVDAGSWPSATMSDDLVAIYKGRLAEKVSLGFPAIGVRERSKIVKEAIGDLLEPRPLLRTQWGMIRLTQYIVEGLNEDRGMYCVRVYLQKGWETGKWAEWSERAAILLEDRTSHLLKKSRDYPIEISDCDEYGIVDICCDFSLAAGPEVAGKAEEECQKAMVDYLFYVFATGLLDTVLTDACSEKPIIFAGEPIMA